MGSANLRIKNREKIRRINPVRCILSQDRSLFHMGPPRSTDRYIYIQYLKISVRRLGKRRVNGGENAHRVSRTARLLFASRERRKALLKAA